ncbi:hypothetical protein GF420_15440 [candidate division GN15 bacterium]|nr:hypothetical protein [candidate division GN15 bacterium]
MPGSFGASKARRSPTGMPVCSPRCFFFWASPPSSSTSWPSNPARTSMALLAITYPDLKEKDYQWIQSIREKYDQPDYKVIGPHFTLVFPVEGVDDDAFIEHVRAISRESTAFTFQLRCVVIVYSKWAKRWLLFLAPDDGYSKLVDLHTRLYTGPLRGKGRFEEPYVPHITVGKFSDRELARDTADALNADEIRVEGSVRTIDIIDYTEGETKSIDRFELRPD